jgi:hypothetical protein
MTSSAVAMRPGIVACSRDLDRCHRPQSRPWPAPSSAVTIWAGVVARRGGAARCYGVPSQPDPALTYRRDSARRFRVLSRPVLALWLAVAARSGDAVPPLRADRASSPAVAGWPDLAPVYCRDPIRRPCVTWLPVTFRMPVRQGPASSSGSACAGRAGERRRLHRAGVQGPSAGRRPQGGPRGPAREAAHAVVFGRRPMRSCSGGAASGHRDTATLGVSLPFGVVREASLRRVRSIAVREALVRRP